MQRKRTKAVAPTWRAFTALQKKNAQLNPQCSGNEPSRCTDLACVHCVAKNAQLNPQCSGNEPSRCTDLACVHCVAKKRTTESTMQWKRTKAVAPTWRAFTALQKNAQLNPQCSGNEPSRCTDLACVHCVAKKRTTESTMQRKRTKPLHRPGVRSLRCKKRTTESTMQRKRTKPLHRPGVRSLRCKNAQLNPQCSGNEPSRCTDLACVHCVAKKRTTESTMQRKRTKAVAPTWRAFTALQKNSHN